MSSPHPLSRRRVPHAVFGTILCLLGVTGIACGWNTMPIQEVRSGSEGVVWTVLQGAEVEKHPVEVIDVMDGYLPKDSLVLVRLKGEVLEHTGVIRGMSGSPVFVDDRWIGSIAYAWSFAKDPIAGVTPAESMIGLMEDVSWPEAPSMISSIDVQSLAVPLVFSGLSQAGLERARSLFEGTGYHVLGGGRSMGEDRCGPLVPGSPLAVILAEGDATVSGVGTVSAVQGEDVLAFGHTMTGGLEDPLPMAGAWIHTVLPSQLVSFKLSSPGQVLGAIVADGPSGIRGKLGAQAPTFPLAVAVRTSRNGQGRDERYDFNISFHRTISPMLVELLCGEALASSRMIGPLCTLYACGEFRFEGMEPLILEDMFSGTSVSADVGMWARQVFGLFFTNKFQKLSPESVRITARVEEGRRVAEIGRVWLDGRRFHPGDEIRVYVELKPWRQEGSETLIVPVTLPLDCPIDRLTLWVLSGAHAAQHSKSRAPFASAPRSLDGLRDVVSSIPRNDEVFIRVTTKKLSLGVDEWELDGLPHSVWHILAESGPEGRVALGKESLLLEESQRTDWMVLGSRSLPLRVELR